MESTREYQPDGSGNAPAKEQDHIENLNDEVFEVMLSDKFQEEFDKHMQTLSKDDTSRAEANFRMGGQFHLHYLKTGSLASLDHAIRYMERTLREIPSSHDRLKTYVAVYTDLLRQRVLKMQVADSVDAYISGIRLGISLLNECTLKEEQRRQLGCAYVSRYWETKEVEFLKLAIDTLEICFENPPKIFPQAAVYLGAVYAQRYEIDDQLDDLTRSVEILRKGLEATPMGHPQSAELIDFGMSHLTSASKVAVYAPCSLEQREQIISNIDQTLSCVTVDNKQTALIKAQRQLLHECNKGAQERSKILYGVGQQFFDKWKSSQNVRMLDRAIQVVRAALDGLPASHTDGAEYADTLIYYTQTKATVFPGAQTTEEYITAVETAVNTTTQQDSVHDGFVQRLAWAYWARFELSRTDDDLNQVIDYINELLDGGNQLLPQTELILGEAFHARFESTKTADNLEKALSLLENALKFSEAGRPVRHIFLQRLVAYSLELLHARPEPDIQRLIVNAKFVIPELPESDTKDEVRSTLSRAETTIELLSQREMLNSVFKTLGDLKLNDKSGPKPIGKTFVPHALYESYKIGASEIRTLELMSGEPDEDIICKLHTVALTDQVKYEVYHICV
jgi:tetratricopeptide (TPR) repeat protein